MRWSLRAAALPIALLVISTQAAHICNEGAKTEVIRHPQAASRCGNGRYERSGAQAPYNGNVQMNGPPNTSGYNCDHLVELQLVKHVVQSHGGLCDELHQHLKEGKITKDQFAAANTRIMEASNHEKNLVYVDDKINAEKKNLLKNEFLGNIDGAAEMRKWRYNAGKTTNGKKLVQEMNDLKKNQDSVKSYLAAEKGRKKLESISDKISKTTDQQKLSELGKEKAKLETAAKSGNWDAVLKANDKHVQDFKTSREKLSNLGKEAKEAKAKSLRELPYQTKLAKAGGSRPDMDLVHSVGSYLQNVNSNAATTGKDHNGAAQHIDNAIADIRSEYKIQSSGKAPTVQRVWSDYQAMIPTIQQGKKQGKKQAANQPAANQPVVNQPVANQQVANQPGQPGANPRKRTSSTQAGPSTSKKAQTATLPIRSGGQSSGQSNSCGTPSGGNLGRRGLACAWKPPQKSSDLAGKSRSAPASSLRASKKAATNEATSQRGSKGVSNRLLQTNGRTSRGSRGLNTQEKGLPAGSATRGQSQSLRASLRRQSKGSSLSSTRTSASSRSPKERSTSGSRTKAFRNSGGRSQTLSSGARQTRSSNSRGLAASNLRSSRANRGGAARSSSKTTPGSRAKSSPRSTGRLGKATSSTKTTIGSRNRQLAKSRSGKDLNTSPRLRKGTANPGSKSNAGSAARRKTLQSHKSGASQRGARKQSLAHAKPPRRSSPGSTNSRSTARGARTNSKGLRSGAARRTTNGSKARPSKVTSGAKRMTATSRKAPTTKMTPRKRLSTGSGRAPTANKASSSKRTALSQKRTSSGPAKALTGLRSASRAGKAPGLTRAAAPSKKGSALNRVATPRKVTSSSNRVAAASRKTIGSHKSTPAPARRASQEKSTTASKRVTSAPIRTSAGSKAATIFGKLTAGAKKTAGALMKAAPAAKKAAPLLKKAGLVSKALSAFSRKGKR